MPDIATFPKEAPSYAQPPSCIVVYRERAISKHVPMREGESPRDAASRAVRIAETWIGFGWCYKHGRQGVVRRRRSASAAKR